MKSRSLWPGLAGLLFCVSLISLAADNAHAQDCSTDKAHEFDFWIGEWETVTNRITWHDNEDGTVRQHWEISKDGGESWSTGFDGLYTRAEGRNQE